MGVKRRTNKILHFNKQVKKMAGFKTIKTQLLSLLEVSF